MAERLGASLRRAPYVWCALTVLVYWTFLPDLDAGLRPHTTSAVIAWISVAYIAGAVVGWLVILRRRLPPAAPDRARNQTALLYWSLGQWPVIGAIGAVGIGGQSWPLGIGLFVSAVLLTVGAHRIATDERSSRTESGDH